MFSEAFPARRPSAKGTSALAFRLAGRQAEAGCSIRREQTPIF